MPGARVLKQRSHGERLYNFAKNRNPSIIQRFSGGETIPRQGGCNISRRSHFVCCERQRYNPAFRHGLAKGHNCAEQIPVSAEGLPLESLFQSETCAPRRSFPLRNGLSSIFSRRTARIKKTVRQRRQRADKARKRKNYPDKKNQWQFLLPILQAFSSLWQSVDFVSILTARQRGIAFFLFPYHPVAPDVLPHAAIARRAKYFCAHNNRRLHQKQGVLTLYAPKIPRKNRSPRQERASGAGRFKNTCFCRRQPPRR